MFQKLCSFFKRKHCQVAVYTDSFPLSQIIYEKKRLYGIYNEYRNIYNTLLYTPQPNIESNLELHLRIAEKGYSIATIRHSKEFFKFKNEMVEHYFQYRDQLINWIEQMEQMAEENVTRELIQAKFLFICDAYSDEYETVLQIYTLDEKIIDKMLTTILYQPPKMSTVNRKRRKTFII